MLILASKLLNTPIMGLQTGSQLALTGNAIINPENLQILAYQLKANSFSNEEMLIRIADIRELSRIGFIIDSGEDFILPTDVVKPEVTVTTEVVPFGTTEQLDATLPKGQTKVVQEGANGERTILTEVTTVDGKQTSKVLENTITKQPVNKVIAIGTKEEATPQPNAPKPEETKPAPQPETPKPEETKPTPQPEKPEEIKPEEKVDKTALKAQIDRALALSMARF